MFSDLLRCGLYHAYSDVERLERVLAQPSTSLHDTWQVDKKAFTREEFDQIAPNNPIVLQEAYYRSYLNSRAIQAAGLAI